MEPLTDAQLEELEGRYKERQLTALREKYSDEMIYALWKRWEKPLLEPGSFTRDTETGEVTGGEILSGGLEGCTTFQELLTKRLKDIESVLLPEIEKIDKSLEGFGKREEYQAAWERVAQDIFTQTLEILCSYGLQYYMEFTDEDWRFGRESAIDLRGANCQDAHFEGGFFQKAYFCCADCCLARFNGAQLWAADFYDAICEETSFDNAICQSVNFKKTDLWGSSFKLADCIDTSFEDSNCENAHFDGADCSNAHFDGAICYKASFKNTGLEKVTFNENSIFLGIDTSAPNWNGNPELKNFVETQQLKWYWQEKTKDSHFGKFWFKIWGDLSDYGRSLFTWAKSGFEIIVLFSLIYFFLWLLGYDSFDNQKIATMNFFLSPKKALSMLFNLTYFSTVTFSSLGFGDFVPCCFASKLAVMFETISGYVMLGGLLQFLGRWLGRR